MAELKEQIEQLLLENKRLSTELKESTRIRPGVNEEISTDTAKDKQAAQLKQKLLEVQHVWKY